MTKQLIMVCLIVIALAAVTVPAPRDVTVNIYNNGFSQVTEKRQVELKDGFNQLTFTDIAKEIDPASINLDNDLFEVRNVDYRYDLISSDRLLERFIGKQIEFLKEDSLQAGVLLNFDEDYIYLGTDGTAGQVMLYEKDDFKYIKLPTLPQGLIKEPTIYAQVNSQRAGRTDVQLSYMTTGIGWQAEYRLFYDQAVSGADISGWVSLTNESGVSFPSAEVVLVAGQVDYEESAPEPSAEQMEKGETYRPRKSQIEPLVDYHRYKLPFRVTIGDNETKQAAMIEPVTIEVERYYKYKWSETKSEVKSIISFINDESADLGLPLPEGRISIFDKETGAFLGSSKIEATPAGEDAEIMLGTAFDITAERKRIDHKKIGRNKNSDRFEIKIRNHKSEKIKVIVAEELYGYWDIVENSGDFTKEDFQNIEFEVTVDPGREKVITYTVEYSY